MVSLHMLEKGGKSWKLRERRLPLLTLAEADGSASTLSMIPAAALSGSVIMVEALGRIRVQLDLQGHIRQRH